MTKTDAVYSRVQTSALLPSIIGVVLAATLLVVLFTAKAPLSQATWLSLGVGLLIPVLACLVFTRLRIVVSQTAVEWSFGLGVGAGRLPLADVTSASAVRNPWYYGWGIRATPHGMLYNIEGLDAVEIRTTTKRIRLGSDDANGLSAAINTACTR